MLSPEAARYRDMQRDFYSQGEATDDDWLQRVIGCYHVHQEYPYEKYLLEHMPQDTSGMYALDFGCGPGRMILRMAPRFKRVDGADISGPIIEGAKRWTKDLEPKPWLRQVDGVSLDGFWTNLYDLVYSTIAFHHIARHDIRMMLLKEFHRVLGPNGRVALQMFYTTAPRTAWMHHADWRDSPDNVPLTNGHHDVRISPENLPMVQEDFESVGFADFSHTMMPYPPGPHPVESATDWICLHARKKWPE